MGNMDQWVGAPFVIAYQEIYAKPTVQNNVLF